MKGFKTVFFMVAAALVGIMDYIEPSILSDALGVGDQGRALIAILVPVGGFLLRMVTSSPMGKKL